MFIIKKKKAAQGHTKKTKQNKKKTNKKRKINKQKTNKKDTDLVWHNNILEFICLSMCPGFILTQRRFSRMLPDTHFLS